MNIYVVHCMHVQLWCVLLPTKEFFFSSPELVKFLPGYLHKCVLHCYCYYDDEDYLLCLLSTHVYCGPWHTAYTLTSVCTSDIVSSTQCCLYIAVLTQLLYLSQTLLPHDKSCLRSNVTLLIAFWTWHTLICEGFGQRSVECIQLHVFIFGWMQ